MSKGGSMGIHPYLWAGIVLLIVGELILLIEIAVKSDYVLVVADFFHNIVERFQNIQSLGNADEDVDDEIDAEALRERNLAERIATTYGLPRGSHGIIVKYQNPSLEGPGIPGSNLESIGLARKIMKRPHVTDGRGCEPIRRKAGTATSIPSQRHKQPPGWLVKQKAK